MMVKKNKIIFDRLSQLEEDDISIIWIKLKKGPWKNLIIGGYYRQWRLPHQSGVDNSGSTTSQLLRFKRFLNQVSNARKICNDVVILGDINIDIHDKNDTMAKYGMKELLEVYKSYMINNNFTVLNDEPARYSANDRPSLINHINTNVHRK